MSPAELWKKFLGSGLDTVSYNDLPYFIRIRTPTFFPEMGITWGERGWVIENPEKFSRWAEANAAAIGWSMSDMEELEVYIIGWELADHDR